MIATAKEFVLTAVAPATAMGPGIQAGVWSPVAVMLLAAAAGGWLLAWRRCRALRAAQRALARRLAQRDEQLAQTAHEMRSPLTAVLNALEIVRAGYTTTPEETLGFLDEADLAARHLAFLINDVLDHAALDAGRLRLQIGPQPVDALLRDGLRVLGMQAARHDVQVRASSEPAGLRVQADGRRFLQVLFNLVGNAIKFSAPGQPVYIHVERDREQLRFGIVDEGTGVPDAVRPHLFSPFAGSDHGRRVDGTGLGLHISRRLVEQMGGTIGYRPRQPRGSEFWFTLPRAAEPTIAPVPIGAR